METVANREIEFISEEDSSEYLINCCCCLILWEIAFFDSTRSFFICFVCLSCAHDVMFYRASVWYLKLKINGSFSNDLHLPSVLFKFPRHFFVITLSYRHEKYNFIRFTRKALPLNIFFPLSFSIKTTQINFREKNEKFGACFLIECYSADVEHMCFKLIIMLGLKN